MRWTSLEITYRTKKLDSICNNFGIARKIHGQNMAEIIHQRINEIRSADSIEFLIQFSLGRCHRLRGDKKDLYAMDLIHPHRLLFSKVGAIIYCVRIEAIEDYH